MKYWIIDLVEWVKYMYLIYYLSFSFFIYEYFIYYLHFLTIFYIFQEAEMLNWPKYFNLEPKWNEDQNEIDKWQLHTLY